MPPSAPSSGTSGARNGGAPASGNPAAAIPADDDDFPPYAIALIAVLGVAAVGGVAFAAVVAVKGWDGATGLFSQKKAPGFGAPTPLTGAQYHNMSALPHGGKPAAVDL